MFDTLGHFVFRRRVPIAIAGAVFLLASAVASLGLFPRLSSGGYENPAAESARVGATLREEFGGGDASLVVLMKSPDGKTLDDPAFAAAAQVRMESLLHHPAAKSVLSYFNTNAAQFVSADRRVTFALVELKPGMDSPEAVRALRADLKRGPYPAQVGGAPAVNADVLEQVGKDLVVAESFALPVTALLLLFVFGSVVAASLPLAMGGLSILGAFFLLRLFVLFTPISVFSANVVSMLGMGLAIDYSLFIVSRFREELAAGKTVEAALVRTLETAGHTVFFSGLTVMLSLLSLLVFPQMLMRSMGIGGSLGVLVAVVGSLTVLPAVLAMLGHNVDKLRVGKRSQPPRLEEHGFWYQLSTFVMRHPVTVIVLTLIPLLVAGSPFLRVRFSMPDERNIPEKLESRVVAEQMRALFQGNALAPIQVVIHEPSSPLQADRVQGLYDFVQGLKRMPGVTRVLGLTSLTPELDAEGAKGYKNFWAMEESGLAPEGQPAKEHFLNGDDTLVQVYFDGDPHGDPARERVRALRKMPPPPGARVQVGGETAKLVDLLADLETSVPRAIALIVVTIFVLLFLMLGSVIVPLKAVILNFLSLSVTFGALVFVFQEGHLQWLLGVPALGSIDALQPMLVFVIAFGLSMDYEVFLLSRMKETFDETQDNTRAVALGLQRTGGIITSAALLLSVVILGFALGKVLSLKQVGVGLLLAVAVDATLVRSLLVPATMRLLGHLNWWAPPPLKRLYERVGLGGLKTGSATTNSERAGS